MNTGIMAVYQFGSLLNDRVKKNRILTLPWYCGHLPERNNPSKGDLKFHMVDYGPSGLLLPKEGMLDKVYQALKGGYPNLHVYKKEDMPARLHYSKHPHILPIVLYADPGYVINGFCIFQKKKGEHSYDNEDMDMKPFFRAVGPDFHRNLFV
ncbi:hypothetical protein cypCar_00024853 [Cyprinus carpio]|nr:hypothetical protein cypCar_00024853 [Cyprinus carpio]